MTLIVFARVVFGVCANGVQKRLVLNGAPVGLTWLLTYALMLIPASLLVVARPTLLPASFWGNILLGGFLDAIGNLAMVAALRATDLSVFGPLNAFRPILALFFGWVFLSEVPTPMGAVGVGVTVAGALLLFNRGDRQLSTVDRRRVGSIVGLRLLGLSLSTVGAVFLKRAATVASVELTLAGWILCGLLCLLVTSWSREPRLLPVLKAAFADHRRWLLLHAALFLVMQWLTIYIFQQTLLAYSFVYFQLGMLLQVILGRVVFGEPAFRWRLAGCLVMGLGSVLIFWKG